MQGIHCSQILGVTHGRSSISLNYFVWWGQPTMVDGALIEQRVDCFKMDAIAAESAAY